ncbi:MAG TPA: triose-phosphate isomerase [Spirochaetota bacterium]|nr:triose-phosphate isomerase [Spirochaetota bacterium]HPI88158.1 triose-phosphate isomerase [Spirochaetota bacterium]HPR47933.1 triose-phosphate isomerase [Spirochaetota bacterium]
MGKREIFAGNWKMYKTGDQAVSLASDLVKGTESLKKSGREVIIFPPSLYLRELSSTCKGSLVSVGAQNMYYEDEGAFTGEISPLMVKDSGCRYILIGHSERRHVFGETDDDVNKKVKAAFTHGLEPVICVGELLDEREKGITNQVVKRQVVKALEGISRDLLSKTIIAYEPVWAIGTGKVATPEIAEEVHSFIRDVLVSLYDNTVAENVPLLYGGSVKPDNIAGLYAMENIDGVLVGGASLKAESFLDIINV